ncbi:MAG: ATP-binding protein, partial [Dehalococcoidia bacterium]
EVLLATAAASDLAGACAQASAAIRRNLSGVDLVNVWMVDEAGETLQLIATVSERVPEAAISRSLPLSDESGAGAAARARASVVWQHDDQRLPDSLRRFMERTQVATLAAIPMRTMRGVSGTLGLGSLERRNYEAEELTFVEALAGQLGGQLELVRARERAEGERRRLLSLVETLPEGLLVIDRDAVVCLHSPVAERILKVAVEGRSMGEILDGMRVLHTDGRPYPPEDLPYRRALSGETSTGVELVLVHPDETETPLLVNCRPVRDPQGEVSGAICVFQDVAPVQELSSLKSDFINTVSHELRTPITTIRGGALTLLKRRQLLDESTQTELLNDIAEESERLHLLVEDLLSLTRSRAGMNVSPEPVVLHRLINRVILELGGRVGSNSLVVNVPPDLPPVDVDPVLTQQVIRNLLENAVKFSPRGRQIEVSAEWHDGPVVVSVLDRGSGVPPDELDRVFEPFYRPDSTVRSGAQGAGLGLAVCRRLIEMQGGRIWAEAREGGGAVFRFTLPLAEE